MQQFASILFATLSSLVPLAAQGAFSLQRATSGALGDVVQFHYAGLPQPVLVLVASFTTGPTPLPPEISGLPLEVGPSLALFAEVVATANGLTAPVPIPNDPLLAGVTLQWQAASLPGTTQLLAGLSNRAATQLAPVLVPTALATTSLGRAWAARIRRPAPFGGHDTWLFAGGALRPIIQQLPLSSSELFDPATLEVAPGPNLPDDVYAMTVTELLDGRTLLTGGVTTLPLPIIPPAQDATNSVVLYDPSANTFLVMPPMATPRFLHSAARLPDGRVIVVGGSATADLAAPIPLASSEIFDPATHTWSPGPSLAAPWFWGALTALSNGELLLHGGLMLTQFGLIPAPTCQRLVASGPGSWAWVAGAPMVEPRVAHDRGTLVLSDGRLLVAGGCVATVLGGLPVLAATASAEIYDVSSGSWSASGYAPRPFFTGTLDQLPNGMVVAAGGLDGLLGTAPVGAQPLSGALSWDPQTGVWQQVGFMQQPRMIGCSAVTADGMLVLLGGQVVTSGGPSNTVVETLRLP